jgi:hypothetical protein
MSSFEKGSAPSSLHDIVNGLSGARPMPSMMAEHHPEKSGPLTRFEKGLKHAQEEFIGKVRTRAVLGAGSNLVPKHPDTP